MAAVAPQRRSPVRPSPVRQRPSRQSPSRQSGEEVTRRPPLRLVIPDATVQHDVGAVAPGGVVRPKRDLARRRRVVVVSCVFLAVAALFGLAAAQSVLVSGQVRIDDLEARLDAQQGRYASLRLEVARLEAPERIVDEAGALGLVPAGEITYLAPSPEAAAPDTVLPNRVPSSADDDSSAPWATAKPFLGARR